MLTARCYLADNERGANKLRRPANPHCKKSMLRANNKDATGDGRAGYESPHANNQFSPENLPSSFKPAIILSYLKDHSLQNDWIKVQPELTELVIGGSLFTGATEALFESCRHGHPVFRQQLELYLKKSLAENTRGDLV